MVFSLMLFSERRSLGVNPRKGGWFYSNGEAYEILCHDISELGTRSTIETVFQSTTITVSQEGEEPSTVTSIFTQVLPTILTKLKLTSIASSILTNDGVATRRSGKPACEDHYSPHPPHVSPPQV